MRLLPATILLVSSSTERATAFIHQHQFSILWNTPQSLHEQNRVCRSATDKNGEDFAIGDQSRKDNEETLDKKDGAVLPEEEDCAYLQSGIDTNAYWRVERARLEEQHNRAIRQRKRIFLSYVDACMWARRMGFSNKEEWDEWIDLGEKRTPYITRDPQTYYEEQGTWRGWDHFLGVNQQQDGEPFRIIETSEHSEID